MKLHQILLLHIATSILALFPSPIYAQKMMYQDSIEIVVHRGANHIAPENTIPSALAALEHGAGWIEVDVRKSKDNILYKDVYKRQTMQEAKCRMHLCNILYGTD